MIELAKSPQTGGPTKSAILLSVILWILGLSGCVAFSVLPGEWPFGEAVDPGAVVAKWGAILFLAASAVAFFSVVGVADREEPGCAVNILLPVVGVILGLAITGAQGYAEEHPDSGILEAFGGFGLTAAKVLVPLAVLVGILKVAYWFNDRPVTCPRCGKVMGIVGGEVDHIGVGIRTRTHYRCSACSSNDEL